MSPTGEARFLQALRRIVRHPAARGLADDAAVLNVPAGARLVLTHDMLAEGVHYRADDPPEDVAWKLVAVNLSDLAAKGAEPLGVLAGYCLGEESWDARFVQGLEVALERFAVPLLGGDTVKLPAGAPRVLGLTAIGSAPGEPPARGGGKPGDVLWVSGTIGAAGLGLRLLEAGSHEPATLVAAYRRPQPRLELGRALAPMVHAMMDVSDGLLIDAVRMAAASGLRAEVALERVPVPGEVVGRGARVEAATAGDDYELLFAAPEAAEPAIRAAAETAGVAVTRIGGLVPGSGLALADEGEALPLPERLGYQHG